VKPKDRTYFRVKSRSKLTSDVNGVDANQVLPKIDPETGAPREGDVWTPWGYVDGPEEYFAGGKILWYETSVHGGFYVAPELNEYIPAEFRIPMGWYEQDEQWPIVAITFPELLPKKMVKKARRQFGMEN
jgi:hypothetical protein